MTGRERFSDAAAAYVAALERFDAQTMAAFLDLCALGIEFRDPFNHTLGRDNFRRVLEHMLKQVDDLRFNVSRHWRQEPGMIIRWRFTGRARFIGALDIPGLSEVEFDDDGLVSRHIDFWDAHEHITSKLPVLGPLVRVAMRPMSI